MSDYLAVERFENLSVLADERIEELHTRKPTYFPTNLELILRTIEDRLRHRYTIPFPAAHPTIEGWMTAIMQARAALKCGIDPGDPGYTEMVRLAQVANTEIAEASDQQSPKWNLPLLTATDTSGISKGEPFGYAESSPYTFTDVQYEGGHSG